MIVVNVDAVVTANGAMLLLKRSVHPMKGWWWFGGRQFFGEKEKDAMARIFRRETGLEIEPGRFELVGAMTYIWATREQVPQDMGSHNRVWTFAVQLTVSELYGMHVDPKEYSTESLRWFYSREELVAEGVHQVILDMWDAIFG